MNAHVVAVSALFGVSYGVVLQRSGFCFSRAAFELFLLRSRDAVNGVMAGLVLATIGFGAVALARLHAGLPVGSHLLALPADTSTVLGAALFGLGMTIAGMCAAGTLQRLGEGYGVAWIVLAGILAGAATYPFAPLFSRWRTAPTRSSMEWGHPALGFALTLVALAGIWLVLLRTAAPSRATSPARLPRLRSLAAPTVIGGAALALLNTAQMAITVPWTVGYPLAMIPSVAASAPGVSIAAVASPLALDAGLVVGALLSSLAQKEFRLSWPRSRRDLLIPLLGGFLMGWGICAARACNIGGVFSAIPSLAVSGWLYLLGLLPGAWLGTKVVARLR